MRIRQGDLRDLQAIREIVERAYELYIERIGARPAPMNDDYAEKLRQGHVFLAEEDGVIGLVVLVGESDHLLIENVAVDPRRQGTGVGRLLLDYAEAHARRHHIPTVRLYTNAAMWENLTLYHHLGYREYDRRREHGFERVFLSKPVQPRQESQT
ncbi:MAG TPA: GNAT family N-acetyltransferase [Solirubrobacteraceae bacterium]